MTIRPVSYTHLDKRNECRFLYRPLIFEDFYIQNHFQRHEENNECARHGE